MSLSDKALFFVKEKENKKLLEKKYASTEVYREVENPFTAFMAGSPGAGKTEFSKTLVGNLEKDFPGLKIVRIDPDEIRSDIPGYTGKNSSEFQRACATAARNLFYFTIKHKQNFVFDGTFSSYGSAKSDVELAVRKKRKVAIFYLHQDPLFSWILTKRREYLEGRPVPLDFFVNAYFKSRENVNKIKNVFKKNVTLYFIEKNYIEKRFSYKINVDRVEDFLQNDYNPTSLKKAIEKLDVDKKLIGKL